MEVIFHFHSLNLALHLHIADIAHSDRTCLGVVIGVLLHYAHVISQVSRCLVKFQGAGQRSVAMPWRRPYIGHHMNCQDPGSLSKTRANTEYVKYIGPQDPGGSAERTLKSGQC